MTDPRGCLEAALSLLHWSWRPVPGINQWINNSWWLDCVLECPSVTNKAIFIANYQLRYNFSWYDAAMGYGRVPVSGNCELLMIDNNHEKWTTESRWVINLPRHKQNFWKVLTKRAKGQSVCRCWTENAQKCITLLIVRLFFSHMKERSGR